METITLSPKARFCSDKRAASEHSDFMATPAFQAAASAAMLAYQFRVCPPPIEVITTMRADARVVDEWASAKLRGAQEFLRELMNIGLTETRETASNDEGRLVPPEESLDRPYAPPKQK